METLPCATSPGSIKPSHKPFAALAGRYLVIVPVLALAGALSGLPSRPATRATLPTNGPLFGGLLLAVTIVVGGLTFLPALVLGPVSAVLGN
jgi:K+-transporting ATPase ATPase A chain